jgi:SAM-dependent methyltransferase
MDAQEYDHWYRTPYGRWIGECEAKSIYNAFEPRPGESLLDVGCGTGFFTRELANRSTGDVVGIDLNPDWIQYAKLHSHGNRISYKVADARALPYPNGSFDLVMCIASLCFIPEEDNVIREILRVGRRCFVIGLLNRFSLLWWKKGRGDGQGGYQGAHWHTVHEAKSLFSGLHVRNLRRRTIIQFPGYGCCSQVIERMWPSIIPTGGFILIAGDIGEVGKGFV